MDLIGGILLSILGLMAAVLTAVIARLITDDIKEWLPRIKVRLIERAVRKLPVHQRERYAEEWSAFINETPGDLSKVIRAFGLGFAADSIAGLVYSGALMFVVERTQGSARRAIDIIVGSVMLLLVAPVFLLTALAIRLDSPGPVIFRQKRPGSGGNTVEVLVFRTMHFGAEMESNHGFDNPEDTHNSDDLDHPNGDPRVTRIGRLIRSLGLDEMPGLINAIRGDLSIASALKSLFLDPRRD
jgi:hypothetical protein